MNRSFFNMTQGILAATALRRPRRAA